MNRITNCLSSVKSTVMYYGGNRAVHIAQATCAKGVSAIGAVGEQFGKLVSMDFPSLEQEFPATVAAQKQTSSTFIGKTIQFVAPSAQDSKVTRVVKTVAIVGAGAVDVTKYMLVDMEWGAWSLEDYQKAFWKGFDFLRNPVAGITQAGSAGLHTALQMVLKNIVKDASLQKFSAHALHVSMKGFHQFAKRLQESPDVVQAHKAFEENPTKDNAHILEAAMQTALGAVKGYSDVHQLLRNELRSALSKEKLDLQLQKLQELLGFNLFEGREEYVQTMLRLFVTSYVPYVCADTSLTGDISREEETALIAQVAGVVQGTVQQTYFNPIAPLLGVTHEVVAAVRKEIASPDSIAAKSPHSEKDQKRISRIQKIFLAILGFFTAIFHGLKEASTSVVNGVNSIRRELSLLREELRPSKGAPSPAKRASLPAQSR